MPKRIKNDKNWREHRETLRVARDFGGHLYLCDECEMAYKLNNGRYCRTGLLLLTELLDRPGMRA